MEDQQLVAALRRGDEAAFRGIVETHHAAMVRVAMFYVPSRAVAEEVVQETWLGVIQGIDRFEGRSTVKTWIYRILTNRARTRGQRERRSMPFSSMGDDNGGTVPPERFQGPQDHWPGHWSDPPTPWTDVPGERLEAEETKALVLEAIRSLPPNQRDVIALRDVEGWSAEEVCSVLGITDGNERILLHRARARVRATLERHFLEVVRA